MSCQVGATGDNFEYVSFSWNLKRICAIDIWHDVSLAMSHQINLKRDNKFISCFNGMFNVSPNSVNKFTKLKVQLFTYFYNLVAKIGMWCSRIWNWLPTPP